MQKNSRVLLHIRETTTMHVYKVTQKIMLHYHTPGHEDIRYCFYVTNPITLTTIKQMIRLYGLSLARVKNSQ